MTTLYDDGWIRATPEAIEIRGYYFPWGTKRIAYDAIRGLRRVQLGLLTGRLRIWGTGNPRYWASLDPRRPRKTTGLILDLGERVRPFITPGDPDALEAAIRERARLDPATQAGGRGPFI